MAVAVLLALAGCNRVQPVYNVQSHIMPTAARALPPERVTLLIVQAAQSGGWSAAQIGPNEVRATQRWRTHSASVVITHDGQSFSIRNDGSTNLLQQGDDIHRAYNTRVQSLEAAIEKRLTQGS